MKDDRGTVRRAAWLADKVCACGSRDRLQVTRPAGLRGGGGGLWTLSEERRAKILPLLTVQCWGCHWRDRLARIGRRPAEHGTVSRYHHGCRCTPCAEARRAKYHTTYVRKTNRRSPTRPWEKTP